MSSTTTMAHDKRYTKHGFPKGFRFVPTNMELCIILSRVIRSRRPLHPKVAAIFHDLNILNYHPQELHDAYERDQEHRFIYFFSYRQLQKPAVAGGGGPANRKRQRGAGGGGQDEDENEPRPVRLAKGGGWKPSGGGHILRWPKEKGGFVAGKMVTMVFYDNPDGHLVKSQWGMHEFTIPEDPRLLSKPTKTTRFYELALYRLYKIKSDDMESDYDDVGAGSSNQTLANISAANGHFSAPVGQPSFGIFTGQNQNQLLAAGPSTSRKPPQQQQQPHMPNVWHPHQYYHHQYGFGAASTSAAHQQQVHTMTMSPAYATGMPGRQLLPYPRPPSYQFVPFVSPPGPGLPGPQSLQFARPPAPSQMPVPLPAAGNLASHQQAPTKAMYGGAGQQVSHSGATRSLPSAPVSTLLPAAVSPSADELAPMIAATHGGAGQEAGGDFGNTRSSLATESQPAEQDATGTAESLATESQPAEQDATSTPESLATESQPAEQDATGTAESLATESQPAEQEATGTAEPGQHVVHQFAGCVKPDETVPPPIPADNYDEIGMLDMDLGVELGIYDDNCLFTLDELMMCSTSFDESQQGDDN